MHLLVVAKEPIPGRVKTRLRPALTAVQAAEVAAACLADTLAAVAACGADRRIVALDGRPGDWLPAGFEVVPQRGAGLDERLTAAWRDAGGPGFQIGMDTPQLTASDLDDALGLVRPGRAALGQAVDGGWWGIGLAAANTECFVGVPMSTSWTGAAQRRRLVELGLRVDDLPELVDIDHVDDLVAVTDAHPHLAVSRLVATAGLAA